MDAAKTVEIVRRIRHDFANHLQVISGYMELARYQEVKDYMAAMVEEMNGERNIFDAIDPEIILYLYEKMLAARDLGIILRYDELQITDVNILKNSDEPFKTLRSLLSELRNTNDEPVLFISIYEDAQQIEMVMNCENFSQNPVRIIVRE